ncbi:MAG: YihY/virulence factor BrkB family protein [Hyphomicrobiaceae bacterium]|nr:YihY/virulence factor BrkB family protein [Hyphomicrobiaceae bacterium]
MTRHRPLLEAIYRLYEHSGFSMAGAVAYAFVVSLFPFCIFLGAVAGLFGGRELAQHAITGLFQVLPPAVAGTLAPQVEQLMGATRIDLLTVGGGIALFFATSAVETLRAALNGAYRQTETRSYPYSLALSMLFVLVAAVSTLVLTWAVVVGPVVAERFEPEWVKDFIDLGWLKSTWLTATSRYAIAALVLVTQLLVLHLWIAAGSRRFADVWPGVALSTLLWLAAGSLYSQYLAFSDYTRFYAGLSQIMVALIFFQVTAVIILLGAELNRGIMELKRMRVAGALGGENDRNLPAV